MTYGMNSSMVGVRDKLAFLGVKNQPDLALTEFEVHTGTGGCCPAVLEFEGKIQLAYGILKRKVKVMHDGIFLLPK